MRPADRVLPLSSSTPTGVVSLPEGDVSVTQSRGPGPGPSALPGVALLGFADVPRSPDPAGPHLAPLACPWDVLRTHWRWPSRRPVALETSQEGRRVRVGDTRQTRGVTASPGHANRRQTQNSAQSQGPQNVPWLRTQVTEPEGESLPRRPRSSLGPNDRSLGIDPMSPCIDGSQASPAGGARRGTS